MGWRATSDIESVEWEPRIRVEIPPGLRVFQLQCERLEIIGDQMIFPGDQREVAIPTTVNAKRHMNVGRTWLFEVNGMFDTVCQISVSGCKIDSQSL